jgi:hypothetical protein
MQQTRSKGSKGWAVFTVVAVVAVGSTVASAWLGRRPQRDFAAAQAKVHAECMKSGVSCNLDGSPPPVLPEYHLGAQELETARAADRTGNPTAAALTLVSVLARADHIDRSKTLVGSLVAAKLFDGVVDNVDADPTLLDDPLLAAAIRRSTFASARRPLQSERLHALTRLGAVPAQVPLRTVGLAESTTTQAMSDVDAALHAMEDDALRGDTKACEAAAQKPQGLAKQVTVGPSICKNVERIVVSGRRFELLKLRATARHEARAKERVRRERG